MIVDPSRSPWRVVPGWPAPTPPLRFTVTLVGITVYGWSGALRRVGSRWPWWGSPCTAAAARFGVLSRDMCQGEVPV